MVTLGPTAEATLVTMIMRSIVIKLQPNLSKHHPQQPRFFQVTIQA
jgi:hypothetical protein